MNSKTFSRCCPLCNSDNKKSLLELSYALFDTCPLSSDFIWTICDECGFSYMDTPSSEVDFLKYYKWNSYYFSTTTSGAGGNSQKENFRYQNAVSMIAKHVKTSQVVFDIGSGKGGFLEALAHQGFSKLYAVDPLSESVDIMNKSNIIIATQGTAAQLPFETVTPSLIVYSHVLEHLLDPLSALKAAFERLPENGHVYIEVPDAMRYGEFSDNPFSELYLEHVNHFDRYHLVMLLQKAGFETIEIGNYLFDTGSSLVPCISGLFKKNSSIRLSLKPDSSLHDKNRHYIHTSQSSQTIALINEAVINNTPLFVWGMSQYAQLLLGSTTLGNANINAYLDSDLFKQTLTIFGRNIESPELLRNAKSSDYVFLTGINFKSVMLNYLNEIGFNGQELALFCEGVLR